MDFYTGDDFDITVTLRSESGLEDISAASSVTAALVDSTQTLSATVSCSDGGGADWANGSVLVSLTSAQTASVATGPAGIQIKVVNGGKTRTWATDLDLNIRTGLI